MRKPGAQGLSLYSKLGRTQKFGWIPKSKIPEAENGLTRARGQRIIHEEEKTIGGRGSCHGHRSSVKEVSVGIQVCTYGLKKLTD